ncbi:phosphate ABC transporter substrate-binding protein [Permianibacter sp. IMCC34836]|uniref:phosphate ABC transporter substrate-binding protein n=1 Tax=Permianibacter fluminis TaxID=2738515 RepID=UPI001556BFAA|nr:phosphate ABC transporter substrate-binding protein [Permianibacter fluminis]NQD38389.1 phosphate ABC transporter substrate-binding protein [Permianibacter fluminis]
MKSCKFFAVALVASLVAAVAQAEVSVVVHPSSPAASMSEDDISKLFLGKSKSFPNGDTAVPINQNEGSAVRDKFNDAVVKKNASQLKAYWSQLVFTGKGTPPKDAGDDAEVKKLVAANPNMIGYIDSSAVDGSVKVVYKIP